MEWAKISQQKALEVRMDKINQQAKDDDKLTEQACNNFVGKHQSEVDSNNSKVSELIDEIGKLKKHLIQLEAMNTSLKHQFAKN